jgi:nucleoside-diphosphate-sugar epimerase
MGQQEAGGLRVKVLVTGGRGLLGTSVVHEVLKAGHECVVVQRNPAGITGAREFLDDLTAPKSTDKWLAGVDAVIHLAARVGIVGSYQEFFGANVAATHILMDAANQHGVKKFIYASSPSVAHTGSALIGAGAGPAEPTRVRGSYSQTKAFAELAVLAANTSSFSTLALRPHLVWGPGDTQLIERIVNRARSGRLFYIDGGYALIDTTYVTNAARAFACALAASPKAFGLAHMVTNGEPRTVRETLMRITQAAGVPAPRRSVSFPLAMAAGRAAELAWRNRPSEPPLTSFLVEQLATAHWFDIEHTKKLLNWSPSVSLAEGFVELEQWYAISSIAR